MSKPLPEQYAWLAKEPAPKMLIEALRLYGTEETIGNQNNPIILEWADTLSLRKVYTADSIPWCGLFMGIVAKRAGKIVVDKPLAAINWKMFGAPCIPELGCVLVFSRKGGNHVGLYVGEDNDYYHVLGGNQGDAVSIVRIKKSRLIESRASYKKKPDNVRVVKLENTGFISTDEA